MNEVSMGYVMIWVLLGLAITGIRIWLADDKIDWNTAFRTLVVMVPLGLVLATIIFTLTGKTVVWSLSP